MLPRTDSVSSKSSRVTITLLLALVVLPAWAEEKVVLDGSSGMLPLAQALATAFQQQSADPQVEIGKGLGTGARLQALAEGKIQIALASHGIKPEDVQ
jgi:phosphate transport system substrate-binding protein